MLQVAGWKLGLTGEVLGREALPQLLPAWDDLCARSVEDNVYYSPRYARSLLASVERNTDVSFATVWCDTRLVALLPFTSPSLGVPMVRPAGQAWQSKYTYSCTPLLDRHGTVEAADALLDVLAQVRRGEWIVPTVNIGGEACQAVIAALSRRAQPWTFLNQFERATLETGRSFEEHMQRHVASKRRKELARNRRRLEELGKVGHATYRFGAELEAAAAAFLNIEASGWKGKRGTALACDKQSLQFAKEAFTGDRSDSICRADVLTLDDVPIAVSLAVLAGETAFTVKCCYDEDYRSYGAGLLLEVEVIRSFLAERWARRLDAGTAGSHVIDSLWPGRVQVADLLFSLSPRHPQLRLAGLQRTLRFRMDFNDWAKRMLSHRRPAAEKEITRSEGKRA